jgi:predicted glycoside hydrolase/deacetylase ChbG (UPF0249 family)
MARRLIVNADDFGYSPGTNQGIVECHTGGVVTSTSLMVTGHAVAEAVALARAHPSLAIGLHFDVWGEDERTFDTEDGEAVRAELERQIEEFHRLMGRPPTHLDSHRHVHREPHLFPLFVQAARPLGIPVRGDGRVTFVGGFYAQWEWQVTNLEYVSVRFLERMIREEVKEGWTEFSCHPGYESPRFPSVYGHEREAEIRTLTDARIRQVIADEGIELLSYREVPPGGAS